MKQSVVTWTRITRIVLPVALVLILGFKVVPAQAQLAGVGRVVDVPIQVSSLFEEIEQALEDALHFVNEVGALVLDFVELITADPWQGFLELLNFIGQMLGLIDGGDGVDGPMPIPGPGLGNQAYPESDVFRPVGWVNQDNGLPGIYPGRKPYGTNLGMMIDGYFFTLFAPDSGQGPGGFLFYDVSDPYHPQLVKRVYEPESRTAAFREPHAFGVARINGRRYMAFQSTIGVEFWDFSDLNDLQRVGEIDLPGVNGGDYSSVSWQLTWQAPYVYVASSEQGIFIVDAGDPANPVLADRGGKPNPIPVSELGGFRVGPIFTFGNQLVISSMQNLDGMASLDISDPLHPQLLDRIADLSQFYYASCFNGEKVAVSVRGPSARMELYDLHAADNFQLLDDQLAVPGQLYCAFQDEYVFQGTEDRVHKIDISDPFNPVDIGSGTISGPLVRLVDHGQVSPLGNLVFVGNDHGTGSAFMPHDSEPDRLPPKVVVTAPRDQAEGVSTSTGIGVSFSDVLDFSSVSEETLRITDEQGRVVAGIYSLQNGIVNFVPSDPLQPFTQYRIQVLANGVRDVMGNAVADGFTASFITGAGNNHLDVDLVLADVTREAQLIDEVSTFAATVDQDLPGAVYVWDFGDGLSSGELLQPLAEHEYSTPGHYQVRLTIRWQGQVYQETFTKTVVPPLTAEPPVQAATLAQTDTAVFVVNPDNNSVTAVSKADQRILWETAVGVNPQTIAVGANDQLWVTLQDDDAIAVLGSNGVVQQIIPLAYGAAPFGVVYHSLNDTYLVTLAGLNQVIEISQQGEVLNRLSLQDPRGIALSGDGSDAFVTRFISPDAGAQVYHLKVAAGLQMFETLLIAADDTTIDTQDRARGVANYLFDVAISPSGDRIVVPAKKDNIFRGLFKDGQTLVHDRTVRAITQQIDLVSGEQREWDFDNRSNPRAVVFSPLGDYLFVALQGSNKVIVVDVFSGSQRVEIETQLAPQGLLIDVAAGHLYVHNFMQRSVSVFDIGGVMDSANFSVTEVAGVTTVTEELLAADVLQGKQIFYNADDARMSRESYFSCASCHVDGGHDGRTWDFTERGEGLRNTITLQGRAGMGHGNVHWTANFDEIQDFENDIRNGFGGNGFLSDEDFAATSDPLGMPKAGLSDELDALAAYVSSLQQVDKSPFKTVQGALAEAAQRGQQVFASLDCGDCHVPPTYTDTKRHSLPTLVAGSGQGISQPLDQIGIETPTLLGLWNNAPYFHHGGAENLEQVILQSGHGNGQGLAQNQRDDLVAYLLSLDGRSPVGIATQQGWQLQNDRWGCLGAENLTPGAKVILQDCSDQVPFWWHDEQGRIRLVGSENLCVEHNGKALYWSRVTLQTCSDSHRQQFNQLESGQWQLAGAKWLALDAFGDFEGAAIGTWWRHGGANQRWSLY